MAWHFAQVHGCSVLFIALWHHPSYRILSLQFVTFSPLEVSFSLNRSLLYGTLIYALGTLTNRSLILIVLLLFSMTFFVFFKLQTITDHYFWGISSCLTFMGYFLIPDVLKNIHLTNFKHSRPNTWRHTSTHFFTQAKLVLVLIFQFHELFLSVLIWPQPPHQCLLLYCTLTIRQNV